jgi:hypothetical protein
MSSENTGRRSGSNPERLSFELPVDAEDVRELDAIRYAHPLPFTEYLDFLTRWRQSWVRAHGQPPLDTNFEQPFEL